jgi:hypothetical protein
VFSPAVRRIGLIRVCPEFCAKPLSITSRATVRNGRLNLQAKAVVLRVTPALSAIWLIADEDGVGPWHP